MIPALFKRIFHIQEIILLLALIALMCVPVALSRLVRDLTLNLSLSITLLGMLLSRGLAALKPHRISTGIILTGLGPLALMLRIGGMWAPLIGIIKESFSLLPALFNLLFYRQPVDLISLFNAREELVQKFLGLGSRLFLWFTSFMHGTRIEDPVVRTLVWCLVLWLTAAWAGWQIYRHKHFPAAMIPSTLTLAFVTDYTGKEVWAMWLHLLLLLFLLGLTGYADKKKHWELSKTDYSDSTGLDTLVAVTLLTAGVTLFSFLFSTISIRDILDNLRERNAQAAEAQAASLGLEPVKDNADLSGAGFGMPRAHLITAGPDLTQDLVMTITTGELPPMTEIAHVPVPRYYWRTLTYQIYTGAGWSNPPAFGEELEPGERLIETVPLNYRILEQNVTFRQQGNGRLYWAGALMQADVPFNAAWLRKTDQNPVLYSNLLAALTSAKQYHADSLVLNVDTQTLRQSTADYPDWVSRQFLALPESVPSRVLGLARDLTAYEPTPFDRALAIQNRLRTIPYTLEVNAPPSNRDAADYFLFDLRQGYCDYYATAMVVLARAAGLPARLVVGYANGIYDSSQAQYIVTENHAHSWVEIYFTNIGWVEFEPTPSQPEIIFAGRSPLETPLQSTRTDPSSWDGLRISLDRLTLVSASLILSAGLLLWIAWDMLRFMLLDPTHAIRLLYGRLRRLARPLNGHNTISQTAHQYADALAARLAVLAGSSKWKDFLSPSGHEIDHLTDLYSTSLFARRTPSRAEMLGALRVWSCLCWRLIMAILMTVRSRNGVPGTAPSHERPDTRTNRR